jgi:hypothetical protein
LFIVGKPAATGDDSLSQGLVPAVTIRLLSGDLEFVPWQIGAVM